MRALLAIIVAMIVRDLRLARRGGGDVLTLVTFFVMVGVVVPFAIGPDKAALMRLAPGIVWIAAFLSMLLGLDRLFRADHEDGTLQALRLSEAPMPVLILAKLVAHWLLTALPLIAASPILAVLLNMEAATFWRTALTLLCGTPALVAFGSLGAALTVALRRGGPIAAILIIPLCVPVLIFGVSAIDAGANIGGERVALLFLCGLSLAATALAPFMAALALKVGED